MRAMILASSVLGLIATASATAGPPAAAEATDGELANLGLDKKLLKADIYRWTDDGWSADPWGTAENPINGKTNQWQSMVMAVAPRGSPRAAQLTRSDKIQLPAARYLVKIYIDQRDQTKSDRNYELGAAEYLGQVESDGEWAPGYQPPKVIAAPRGS